jgi:hypothetical protein
MNRTLAIFLALALAPAAAFAKPMMRHPCGPLPDNFDKLVRRGSMTAQTAYRKELAAKKLKPWSKKVLVTAHRPDETTAPSTTGVVIDLLPRYDGSRPVAELVVDAKGTLYQVRRQPEKIGRVYYRCGCGPTGAGADEMRLRYTVELPAGTKYGGTVDISYEDPVPTTEWDSSTMDCDNR